MKVEVTGIDINLIKLDSTRANIMSGDDKIISGKIYCNISNKNNLVQFLGSQQIDIKTVPGNLKTRIQQLILDLEKELNK